MPPATAPKALARGVRPGTLRLDTSAPPKSPADQAPRAVDDPTPDDVPGASGTLGDGARGQAAVGSSSSGGYGDSESHMAARDIEIRPLWLRFRRLKTEYL